MSCRDLWAPASVSRDKRCGAVCVRVRVHACVYYDWKHALNMLAVVDVAQTKLGCSSLAPSKEFHPLFEFR